MLFGQRGGRGNNFRRWREQLAFCYFESRVEQFPSRVWGAGYSFGQGMGLGYHSTHSTTAEEKGRAGYCMLVKMMRETLARQVFLDHFAGMATMLEMTCPCM
jgi:hypothetical protein